LESEPGVVLHPLTKVSQDFLGSFESIQAASSELADGKRPAANLYQFSGWDIMTILWGFSFLKNIKMEIILVGSIGLVQRNLDDFDGEQ
jgi:hypothetical protein